MFHIEYIAVIPLMLMCIILMIVLLCLLVYQLFYSDAREKHQKIVSSITTGTICCIICGILSSILNFLHCGYYFLTNKDMYLVHNLRIIVVISVGIYYLQCISLYIVVFSRLYYTFKEVFYSLNKLTISIVITLIIITGIGMIANCVLLYLLNPSSNVFYPIQFVICIFFIATDITLNIIMLILFIHKLQKAIIIANGLSNKVSEVISIESGDISLNQYQDKLIFVITRNTVLSSIAIIWNQLYFATVIYGYHVSNIYNDNQIVMSLYFVIFSYGMAVIASTVFSITLYLNFGFNADKYDKICSICDNACYRCCVYWTQKRLRNNDNELKVNLQSESMTEY